MVGVDRLRTKTPLCMVFVLVALTLPGCGGGGMLTGGPGSLRIVSTTQPTRLDASFRTAVYAYSDENTADLYFTDLTPEQLQALATGQSVGATAPDGAQLLHVHLFLTPRAGRTPIEFTASNVTLTHYVLVGEEVGVYGGGGFLLPSRMFTREPGNDRFGGQMREATLRFLNGTSGFEDRLGSTTVDGTVNATLDPEGARQMATVISQLSRAAGRF
ncbi:MAG: hypothetical protein ACF8MJ_03040 [Phycisphaerales bacterium JB050]